MMRKVILLIMDGWGLGRGDYSDAIAHARVPFYQQLQKDKKYPYATLGACGEVVGLPPGQMGNSEVGHLNLGAGRIVYQELQRVNLAISNKTLMQNVAFKALISYAKQHAKPIHLMGLISDGGVHSHIDHVIGILNFLAAEKVQVFVHAFMDGRDTDPQSGKGFIQQLQSVADKTNAVIASVSGRYYAMDRDKRWERIQKAYDALVKGKGEQAFTALQAIENSYRNGITDEFILPTLMVDAQHHPLATIKEGDAVFCINFRTDRCREITEVLTQKDVSEYGMKKIPLHYLTMTQYDKTFQNVDAVFSDENISNTLGEILEQNNCKQIRIAETEKYPHVTFFFSGGREKEFSGETRIIIPSPKVATYDLQPEMSAYEITNAILPEIRNKSADFICLNFANPDMVGHTGDWDAVIKALETVDGCVQKIVSACLENDYTVFLTADHGNADVMKNEDLTPNTAHSLNAVPLFVISQEQVPSLIPTGKLGDIAPTILSWMKLPIPKEMTGNILLEK